MTKIFWIAVFMLIAAATAEPWWYGVPYPVASSMAYSYGGYSAPILGASAPLVNTGPPLYLDGSTGLAFPYGPGLEYVYRR